MTEKLTIGGVVLPVLNFAMQQNQLQAIRRIILANQSEEPVEDVYLLISFEPEFAHELRIDVGCIGTEQPVEISPVRLTLISGFLLALTEKMAASIRMEAWSGDELLAARDYPIELLAYDQWTGVSVLPELLSAFVTPNHPSVVSLTAKAGKYLQKWSGSPSFTAYQTGNPNAVKLQMTALYAAIQEENIAYITAPPGFSAGQRIRLPDTVLSGKQGNCIEMTLLYASALEAVGLHPILILVKGHAFCGCWLEEQCFPESVQDDPSLIIKRIADGVDELCLVECTCMNAGDSVSFDEAVRAANGRIRNTAEFHLALDVVRTRAAGVCPIPMRVVVDGQYEAVDYGKRGSDEITGAPDQLDVHADMSGFAPEQLTRQRLWERRLLDLSLRNSLLSFRANRNAVQLMAGRLATLEDALSGGDAFKLAPRPSDWDIGGELKDSRIYAPQTDNEELERVIALEFKSKRLRALLDEKALEENLKALLRQSRVSLEENGANTLYLALGFLRWYESDIAERARYAPLVLLPVELSRRAQAKEYSLRIRDEEPQINITLLEMLRQDYGIDIGGLDPLPTDQSGIDLKLVFSVMRQAVINKKRWDVEEIAFLGLFSFTQFIMWNDIRNRSDDLQKNKIVRSLISGKLEWEPLTGLLTPEELDEKLLPSDTAVPSSADSSQLAAICAAAAGQSFVLHGPPGTGKSQTITNMIANALYQGKSVLFVAEKMAALTVVQKRLAKIGLDPFCLELHSNKARKRDVLDQLENTLAVGRIKRPEEYEAQAKRLNELRRRLNGTIGELHRSRSFGGSLYDAIVRYEKNIEYKGRLHFSPEQVSALTPELTERQRDIIGRLGIAVKDCVSSSGRVLAEHPLRRFGSREYSISRRDALSGRINELTPLLCSVEKALSGAEAVFPAGSLRSDGSYVAISSLWELADTLIRCEKLPSGLIRAEGLDEYTGAIEEAAAHIAAKNAAEAELSAIFEPSVYTYNEADALMRWRQMQQSWLQKLTGSGKLLRELRAFAKDPQAVTKDNFEALCVKLSERRAEEEKINSAGADMQKLFGPMWKGGASDGPALIKASEAAQRLNSAIRKAACGPAGRRALAEFTADAVTDLPGFYAQNGAKLQPLLDVFPRVRAITDTMQTVDGIALSDMQAQPGWTGAMLDLLDTWTGALDGMRSWCELLRISDEAAEAGIEALPAACRAGVLGEKDILPAFECALGRACALYAIEQSPALAHFSGVQFEEQIRRFRQADSEFERLTVHELAATLSAKLPQVSSGMSGSSEIGILQRAIKSGGRGTTIRKLFDTIPTLLRRLCPCMLMSPISVAQYIDPNFPKFDLVIFDEASQLPTCESVGAIARGENAIIVGDPKQLPPTSFFKSNRVDEENLDKEDLESLLDDCLALSMPSMHLLWHYRSRHESLIAYSNMKYYDNRLYTFPSPNDLVSKVRLVQLEGCYERGGSKQNRAEAEAVVAEIVRRLSDPKLRGDSIGVVTFNIVQQNLIDDLLVEAFREHPELDDINSASAEPVFIKNLENVQGDERDVILFSIGYGPDKDGRVAMNFGPLNRDGGWRRLNVAISRARKEMIVFSVLRPDQIDLSRTSSEGLAGLKGFLEFAAFGKNSLARSSRTPAEKPEGIERIVAERLRALGYTVNCHVGCSEYRLDIGVVHPERPQEYILGILCDGGSCRDARTARDRDVSQPGVLRSLGWNLCRVWSLDWMDDPERELARIRREIDAALERERSEAEQAEMPEETKAPPAEEAERKYQAEAKPAEKPPGHFANSELQFEREESAPYTACAVYSSIKVSQPADPESFYLPQTFAAIKRFVTAVVGREAPISRRLLIRRVIGAWGISRSGAKAEEVIDRAISANGFGSTVSTGMTFYWNSTQLPEDYSIYRTPEPGCDKRAMDDICPEEIANAVRSVADMQLSLSRTDLIRETAKLFGFTRVGGVIENAVSAGIAAAQARGDIDISPDGERIMQKQK